MSQNVNRVLTHRMLLSQVWGPGYVNDTHTLFVRIANLRSKIEINPTACTFIQTERKIGYHFLGVKHENLLGSAESLDDVHTDC